MKAIRPATGSRWPFVALAAMAALLCLLVAYECQAQDEGRSPPTHQLWACTGQTVCWPRGIPVGYTVCLLVAASLKMILPEGSKVTCEKLK